jgi:uncharacterized phage-associated protein
MQFEYDERKLTELIVYVAGRLADDRVGGPTKLHTVLFFADFTHLRRHRRPITGAEYQHCAHGPAPRRLRSIRSHLIASGEAELVIDDFLGRPQHRLLARRPADLTAFSDDELATIDSVLDDLAGLTAGQITTLSHEEPAWKHTRDGESIPYELALVPKQQVITPTTRRLVAEVVARYGLADAS